MEKKTFWTRVVARDEKGVPLREVALAQRKVSPIPMFTCENNHTHQGTSEHDGNGEYLPPPFCEHCYPPPDAVTQLGHDLAKHREASQGRHGDIREVLTGLGDRVTQHRETSQEGHAATREELSAMGKRIDGLGEQLGRIEDLLRRALAGLPLAPSTLPPKPRGDA